MLAGVSATIVSEMLGLGQDQSRDHQLTGTRRVVAVVKVYRYQEVPTATVEKKKDGNKRVGCYQYLRLSW